MSPRVEVSSKRLAALASKILKGYEPTRTEVRSLAASVLTQTADKPKRVAKKAKRSTLPTTRAR